MGKSSLNKKKLTLKTFKHLLSIKLIMNNREKKEKLEKSGITVCSGWKRGCFNETIDGYKKCLNCREKERIKDKKLRTSKINNAITFNKNNEDKKMCKICNGIESSKTFDIETVKCSECSEKSKIICKIRNPREQDKAKLYDYKKSAKKRNLEFEISDDDFLNIVKQPCHYCKYNDSVIGVDRKDSNKGYIYNNVLPCCEQCNLMKNNSTYDNFIAMCKHISTINNKIKEKLDHILFHVSPNGQYAKYKLDAERRNIPFELSRDELKSIVLNKCTYCNTSGDGYYGSGAGGIDRVDSSKGYIFSNCVPCCFSCNQMKLNYSKDNFINQCYKITSNLNFPDTLETDIINFFEKYSHNKEKIQRQMPTFYHSNDFYEYRKWSGNLDDLIKIKIELEFVENSDQKDIWNYYRWIISSLKTFKPNNFIGRIICILVKDSITNKYLGIMSLSSDIIGMEDRDKAIGWTNENKIKNKKINHLMNLSTCVSIQPFGFNFNGGKLLAKLAFSKEVIDKFYEKFNQELLAIVTTGLYGKSVQYDRLQEIKYIGKTKGNSIYWIPENITEKCRKYLKLHHNYDTTGFKKLAVISKIILVLNLNKDDVLASNEKSIYLGFTRLDSKKYLCEKIDKLNKYNFKSAQEIFNDWMNRWAIQRYTHLKNNNKIESHNYIKSTERTSRYKEKLKKELGEEKYKELISIQNQKTYNNKKSTLNNIINTNPNIIKKIEYIEKKPAKKIDETNPDKLLLPINFTHFIENSDEYFAFNKYVNKVRHASKYKLRSTNIQKEFDDFVKIINLKFPELNIPPYTIPNILEKQSDKSVSKENLTIIKPVMPTNFSICRINDIDYIQFCKKIDDKKHQYKTKINSYDIQSELNRFIQELNEKYDFGLNPSEYKIINTNEWKTTNNIVIHEDTPEKIAQRERTNKYLEKQKQEIGEDNFKKLKAEYAKKYRNKNKEIEV
jgi:hypothetical protein